MARHAARQTGRRESRTAWKLFLVLWIVFIWVHSLIPGSASSVESMFFAKLVRPIFKLVAITDLDTINLILRKAAHFSEYCGLAMLAVVALQPRLSVPLFPAVLTVLIGVAVPSIDEFIQVYVPGRMGTPVDVLIDLAGYTVGALFALAIRSGLDGRERRLAEVEYRMRQERAAHRRRDARLKAQERARKIEEERRQAERALLERPLYTPMTMQPTHARHAKHARIRVEPEGNRRRFEDATRR